MSHHASVPSRLLVQSDCEKRPLHTVLDVSKENRWQLRSFETCSVEQQWSLLGLRFHHWTWLGPSPDYDDHDDTDIPLTMITTVRMTKTMTTMTMTVTVAVTITVTTHRCGLTVLTDDMIAFEVT